MFTEVMVRVMQIRVSDPKFRVFNWTHAVVAYVASQVIKEDGRRRDGCNNRRSVGELFLPFLSLGRASYGMFGIAPEHFRD